jgi:hypothetical protein
MTLSSSCPRISLFILSSRWSIMAILEVKLSKMQNHAGGHILRSLCGANGVKINTYWKQRERATSQGQDTSNTHQLQQIRENPCGFCGLDGCLTKSTGEKIWKFNQVHCHIKLPLSNAVKKCTSFFQQYAMYQCSNTLSHYFQGTHKPSGNTDINNKNRPRHTGCIGIIIYIFSTIVI